MSATTISELAADALATVLGDLAVVREISHDGEWFLPAVVRHADPARRATISATIGEFPMAVPGSGVLQTVADGSSVLKALVAQDCVHNRVHPEALQHFGEAGIHSMIVAPAFADGEVVGLVAVTRDAPGRPYTRVDLVTAERAAAIVGAGIARRPADVRVLGPAPVARRGGLEPARCGRERAVRADRREQRPTWPSSCATRRAGSSSANEAGSRLVGIPVAELVGRRLPDLVAEATRAEHVELLERLLRGELNYADRADPLRAQQQCRRRRGRREARPDRGQTRRRARRASATHASRIPSAP